MPWDAIVANRSAAPPRQVLSDDVLAGLCSGKIVASVAPTIPGVGPDNFVQFVLDCVWAAVDGQLPPEKVAEAVQAVGTQADVTQVLDNVFWIVWTDIAGDKRGGPRLDDYDTNEHVLRLVDVIRGCLGAQLIDRQALLSTQEAYLLFQLGLIEPPDEKRAFKFTSKCLTTANTRGAKLFRYNTFREESEGYSKLLTLLNNEALARVRDWGALYKEVTKLIGCFDLCPSKVLDCIFGAVEVSPDRAGVLLKLAPLGHTSTSNALLSLRMREVVSTPARSPPFFRLAALLLRERIAQPQDLLALLAEDLPALKQSFAAALVPDALKAARVAACSHRGFASDSDFAVDVAGVDVGVADAIGPSRHLVMLQTLLEQSAWDVAHTLLHVLSAALGQSPVAHRGVGLALLGVLDELLAPAHDALFPDGPFGRCLLPPLRQEYPARRPVTLPDAEPLTPEVVQALHWLGAYCFRSPRVLMRVLRVLRHVMLTHPPASAAFLAAERVVREVALPSALLVQGNHAVSLAVWGCVGVLPYERRFALYNHIKRLRDASARGGAAGGAAAPKNGAKAAVAAVPLLKVQDTMVEDEFRRVLRRMSLPSDLEQREKAITESSRNVAKLAAGSPFVVAETMRWNAMNYSNQHETLIEASRLLPAFQLDVFLHAFLTTLTSTKPPRINPSDNTNLNEWLVLVSAFLTSFLARYKLCDLSALCHYIYLRLRTGDAYEIIILHDLLTKLLGIHVVSELSRDQLAALPGSYMLRAVSLMTPLTCTEDFQRAQSERLLGALQAAADPRRHLATPVFVTLCQLRHVLCSQFSSGKVKLISEMYDRTQMTLSQYIHFMHRLPEAEYAKLLLPIEQLWQVYQLDKESIMTLHRPVLRKALESWDGGFVAIPELGGGGAAADHDGRDAGANGDSEAAAPSPHSLQGLARSLYRILGSEYKPLLSQFNPALYILFWALDLHDLEFPEASYKEHLEQLQRQKRELEGRIASMTRDLSEQKRRREVPQYYGGRQGGPDAVTVNAHEITALEQQLSQISSAVDVLPTQQAQHAAHVQRMHALILTGRQSYFLVPSEQAAPKEAASNRDSYVKVMKTNMWLLLQECILPRCLNSHEDALYCACILNHIFKLRVPGFNYVSLLDTVFKEVISLMSCITDREAQLLVVFVRQLAMFLEPLNDPDVYERDMANSDACRSTFSEAAAKGGGKGAERARKKGAKPSDLNVTFVDFQNWGKLTTKWQDRVCQNLSEMMRSKLDTSVRNALKMAQDLMPYIPSKMSALRPLAAAIDELLKVVSEDKQDVKQLALAAQRQLEAHAKTLQPADGKSSRPGGGTPDRAAPEAEADDGRKAPRGRGMLRADAREFLPRGEKRVKEQLEAGELEAGEVAEEAAPVRPSGKGGRRGGDDGDGPGGRKRRADAVEPGEQQPGRQRARQEGGGSARGLSPSRHDRYEDGGRGGPSRRMGGGGMRSDAYI